MRKILIRNASFVVTMNQSNEVLKNCDLYVEDGFIQKIGTGIAPGDATIIEANGMIVFPGLINTHHHFYQVLTRNIPEIQNLELFDWLLWLYERWRYLTAEMLYDASLVAMGELVRYGCTTMVDHHYVFPQAQIGLIEAQFEAADKLGVRLHACRGSMSKGKSSGGLPPDDLVQTSKEILEDSQALIERFHDPSLGSRRQIILAPCSPFSVDDDLMRQSAVLAREYNVMLHTHLAETMDEVRYCLETFGKRPLAYMEDLGWIGKDVFFAHGIYFDDEEIQRLADSKTGVAHCPVSNMKLSSGIARVAELLKMGVPVGLAVDGSASNDASNLMYEIRTAYLLQRLHYKEKAPSASEILSMATSGGAGLLHREDLGVLEPGRCADLFMVSKDRLALAGCLDDVTSIPATVGIQEPVDLTMVGGEIIYQDGAFRGIHEKEVLRKVNMYSKMLR